MAEPFIRLNAGGPPPPPPGHHGTAPRPMQHPPMQPGFPPPPNRAALPIDLRHNRPVIEEMDLREQFLSESDKRRRLTEYKPVRFEKVASQDLYDDDDRERAQTSWERAIKTNVQGMSKRDILDVIHRLDATTQDVTQKKATLAPALLRQLDCELDKLSQTDLDRGNFVWTLAQIDQQLQEIDREIAMQIKAKTPRVAKHAHKSKKRSSTSSVPKKQKRYWERVSLTAYFKRSPRPQANIAHLYDMSKRVLATAQGGGLQHPIAMNAPGIHPMAGNPQGGHGPVKGGPPPFMKVGPGGGGPPPPPQGHHPAMKTAPGKGLHPKVKHISDSNSDTSSSSDDSDNSSDSEQSRTTMTTDPPSSPLFNKRGRRRIQDRHRSRSRPRDSSRYYGVHSRHNKRHDKHYFVEPGRQIPSIPPPPIMPQILPQVQVPQVQVPQMQVPQGQVDDLERIRSAYNAGRVDERYDRQSPSRSSGFRTSASDIERIRDDAYKAGVEDTRIREERFVEELEIETRPRRVTRVYQVPRRGVRTVDPRFLAREGLREQRLGSFMDDDLPRLDRLSMDDHEWEYHESPPRRAEASRPYRHDYTAYYDSAGDEDDFLSSTRGVEIHEIRRRPSMGQRPRTDDYIGGRPVPPSMNVGRESHVNPFTPMFSPVRGRSYERRHR